MEMKLTTTLHRLRIAEACTRGYEKLKKAIGDDFPDDRPINLLTILESNGLDDALWALRAAVEDCDKVARLMAADFAEQVLPLWRAYSENKAPELAIKAARDYAHRRITKKELIAAAGAAGAALAAAGAAGAAARQKQREIFIGYLQEEQ